MRPAGRLHRLLLLPLIIVLTLPLSGCLAAMIPASTGTAAPQSPGGSTGDPGVDAPGARETDWSALPGCDIESTLPWVLVEDFPRDAVDAAGLQPLCGDIWTDAGHPDFAGIVLDPVTSEQLDTMSAQLISADFELMFDDFDPAKASDQDYYGALDFYLDGIHEGDFTRTALEIYPSKVDEGAWTVFFDFESPSVRALVG